MRRLFSFIAIAAATACSAPDRSAIASPAPHDSVSFIVIGDTPYSPADEAMLASALPAIRSANYPFVLHIGDYKGGRAECLPEFDDRFAKLIADLAPTPVIYTPGDNEWTDCDRHKDAATGNPVSDLKRLDLIRARFFAAPPRTPDSFEFERQPAQIENASWKHGQLRFATLHVVGTANGRAFVVGDAIEDAVQAADARDTANLLWIAQTASTAKKENARALVFAMQADMTDVSGKPCIAALATKYVCDAFGPLRAAIRKAATDFGGPTLVIHGDTSPFTLNQSFAGDEAPSLWRLNAAGDAGDSPRANRDVTLVTIAGTGRAPFAARGLVTGKAPKN